MYAMRDVLFAADHTIKNAQIKSFRHIEILKSRILLVFEHTDSPTSSARLVLPFAYNGSQQK